MQMHDGFLRRAGETGLELWISGQNIREYLAAITRPQAGIEATPMPVAIERARFFVQRFQLAEDGSPVREHLLTLLAGTPIAGKQVRDANLVATMLATGLPAC